MFKNKNTIQIGRAFGTDRDVTLTTGSIYFKFNSACAVPAYHFYKSCIYPNPVIKVHYSHNQGYQCLDCSNITSKEHFFFISKHAGMIDKIVHIIRSVLKAQRCLKHNKTQCQVDMDEQERCSKQNTIPSGHG